MPFFQRDTEVQLYYEITGEGSPLLLIHGFMGTGQTEFPDVLQQLSQQYQVITPDLRGYGQSQPKPRLYGTDFYQQDAEDVAALIEHLGYEKLMVMGYSDGGEVALYLPLLLPEHIQNVVTWGATGHFSPEIRGNIMSMLQMRWATDTIRTLHGAEHIEKMTKRWVTSMLGIINAGGDLTFSRAENITCPTLMMLGDQDFLNPVSLGQAMADKLPQGQLKVFPTTGHAIHLEQPKGFYQAVMDFLK